MSILKYNEYLTEKQIVDLINESLLVYSTKLVNLLKRMPRNRIAVELLRLNKSDVDGITQNYIDVTDRESVTVTHPPSVTREAALPLGCNVVTDKKPILGSTEASCTTASHLRI